MIWMLPICSAPAFWACRCRKINYAPTHPATALQFLFLDGLMCMQEPKPHEVGFVAGLRMRDLIKPPDVWSLFLEPCE